MGNINHDFFLSISLCRNSPRNNSVSYRFVCGWHQILFHLVTFVRSFFRLFCISFVLTVRCGIRKNVEPCLAARSTSSLPIMPI